MRNINITNFRQNIIDYINQAIEYNDIININTKNGNAVVMSEEEYNGLMETLYLSSQPGLKEELMERMRSPLSESIPENEVEW